MSPRATPGEANFQVGRNVRAAREAKGWSGRGFAFLCGWDQPQIYRLEQGEVNITVEQLCVVGRALGCAPSRFLRGVR